MHTGVPCSDDSLPPPSLLQLVAPGMLQDFTVFLRDFLFFAGFHIEYCKKSCKIKKYPERLEGNYLAGLGLLKMLHRDLICSKYSNIDLGLIY